MTERVGEWQLRRWCPVAKTHQDVDDVKCNWYDCMNNYGYHNLRKRRMLICSECKQGCFNQKEFDEHECYSAY